MFQLMTYTPTEEMHHRRLHQMQIHLQSLVAVEQLKSPLLLLKFFIWHKTFIGEKTRVTSENSGRHEFTIDFTIGRKLVKITWVFLW